MFVSPINSITFNGKATPLQESAKEAAKKIIESEKKGFKDVAMLITNSFDISKDHSYYKEFFDKMGIKDVAVKGNVIQITNKKNNPFKIITELAISQEIADAIVMREAQGLTKNYGISAYLNLINNFDRFDIIKKGMQIHKNELEYVPTDIKEKIVTSLSKILDKRISTKDIFCINSEIFYPDKKTNSVYSVPLTEHKLKEKYVKTCTFINDETGKSIGFERTAYDILSGKMKTTRYVEQQEPYKALPEIVDIDEHIEFANACRFGNKNLTSRYENVTAQIIDQLKRGGISDPKIEDIKIVKYLDNEIKKVILAFFNKRNGCSILFDKDGHYIGQMQYLKNDDGEIINYIIN